MVSGANKGIGKEIARGLAQKGYHVLVGARKKELGESAAAELAEHGEVSFLQLDVTDPESVIAAAAAVTSKFGHLDVLVNNAGISQVPGQEHLPALTEIAVEDAAAQFAFIYQTNVFAVITVTNAFLPLLKRAPAARIVNVSSSLASLTRGKTISMYTAYSTSKTALNAITVHYAEISRTHQSRSTVYVLVTVPQPSITSKVPKIHLTVPRLQSPWRCCLLMVQLEGFLMMMALSHGNVYSFR